MKRKELKNLAEKIAKLESAYDNATSEQEKREINQEITKWTSKVDGLGDILILDEMIQDILRKNS